MRGSFVRVVGPPMSSPARAGQRGGASDREPEFEPHEAFALDRPISAPAPAASGFGSAWAAELDRNELILPPPPGAADLEPASSPHAAGSPPILQGPNPAARSVVLSPPAARPAVAVLRQPLPELPSINPFAGFEAPRENWLQRSAIVFMVALALVGVCALAAIALGLLGKRGW